MRYVFISSGIVSKKSTTLGMSIKDEAPGAFVLGVETLVLRSATAGTGAAETIFREGSISWESTCSKLESVSSSGSSAESNDDSACNAFIAATGDKLGLGKHISCAATLSTSVSCEAESWDRFWESESGTYSVSWLSEASRSCCPEFSSSGITELTGSDTGGRPNCLLLSETIVRVREGSLLV